MATKGLSAVERTLADMRGRGWSAAVVERWNPHAGIRQDLFGVFDLIAVTPDRILGVQVKSDGDGAAKAKAKFEATPVSAKWLAAFGGIEIWVWRRTKPRGTKQVRWALRRVVAEAAPGGIYWQEEASG